MLWHSVSGRILQEDARYGWVKWTVKSTQRACGQQSDSALHGQRRDGRVADGVTAVSSNHHYTSISTDTAYQQPSLKSTASLPHTKYLSQWTVFKLLNTLRPTATGFDQLVVHRSWCHIFLQATRPSLQSLHSNINIVPNQWKAAYIRHLTRHSFRTSLADLIEDADDNLFNSILYNNEHVLNRILPIKTESTYQLRPRRHNRSLTIKANATNECDFIVRMLSKDIY